MGFLAPWFLGGIAAIGLPLWIHLLRQYRSTPQPFSSLMFFEARTQSSLRHRRLRYRLLLASRIALLLLMALAFANPFINRPAAAASGRKLLVIALDRSFSMRYGDHLARAKDQAVSALSGLSSGGQGQVLGLDSRVEFLTQPTADRSALRSAIESVTASDRRSSYGELARALRTLSASSALSLDVHFFSDAQKSSMPEDFAALQLAPRTDFILHSVAAANEPNWVVESVTAPARVFDAGKHRVRATIAGYQTELAERKVSLLLDNRVLETKAVTVPAGGRATVEFLTLETPYGFHRGEVRITPYDRLAQDDRFPFSVERSDPRPILFLGEPNRDRASFYYRTALEAAPDSGFTLESMPARQAANVFLSQYAFVVLSNPGELPAGLEDNLRRYVTAGGSLFIALGPASVVRGRVPVSGEAIGDSHSPSHSRNATSADTQHPALRRANGLDAVQFYQAVRLEPAGERVLARLSDQTPLLVEKQLGEGRVLVFASAFDNLSNDFPLHSSFVPFVEESARYLGGQDQSIPNLPVDSYAELRRAREQGASVAVLGPDNKPALSLAEATSARTYQLAREGFYEVRRADGGRRLLAVHADRQESDLSIIPDETLALWRNSGRDRPSDASSAPSSTSASSGSTQPWSLWRYALILVLVAAFLESLLAERYLVAQKEIV